MLDFYEGEQLRRSVLIRNALRRTTQQKTRRTAEEVDALFYGDQATAVTESVSVVSDADMAAVQPIDHFSTRIDVSDYEYEAEYDTSDEEDLDSSYDYSSDEEEDESFPDSKDEHTWFADLLDEVSIEAPPSRVHDTTPVITSCHTSDGESSTPSLIDDEEDSATTSGEEYGDDDEAEHNTVLGRRTYHHYSTTTKRRDTPVMRPVILSRP